MCASCLARADKFGPRGAGGGGGKEAQRGPRGESKGAVEKKTQIGCKF